MARTRRNRRDDSPLLAMEVWLRHNGLPLVVPPRRRLRGIVPRTVPWLVIFACFATGLVIADAGISAGGDLDLDTLDPLKLVTPMLAATAFILAAVPAGIGYGVLQRRLTPPARLIVGIIVIGFWLIGLSVIASVAHASLGLHLGIADRLGLLLLALAIGYSGIGSMVGWAARRGGRELAAAIPAIARVLPLLLLTVLLVFFTNELWQLAATMTTPKMWQLSGFLVLMMVLIALPATRDMINAADDDCEPLLEATPFAGIAPDATQEHAKLTIGERLNLFAVSLAVQFVQIALFVAATFTVFSLFGAISLTDELIATWTGEPARPLTVLGVQLPIEEHVFRVCLILSLFSGISFTASTLQDQLYRSLFLQRVAQEVSRNLGARNRYRATLIASGRAPQRWTELADD